MAEWEYVKIKGNKKIIMKKIKGKLKKIKTENITMAKKKWFKKAILAKKPNTLGGWGKGKKIAIRRRLALASRPKSWTLKHRRLSAGRALQALANITKDKETREKAKADAKHFFGQNGGK